MAHRSAPLTALGRQRAVSQVIDPGRPIAHVAAELRIARATLSKWVARYRAEDESGPQEHPSTPANRPSRLPVWVFELVERWRRTMKWCARRIARELAEGHGVQCCVRTVTRWLDRLGLNRIRNITPEGENLREPGKIIARYPGHTVHMDVKKIGRIPDGGGWWLHGRGNNLALAGKRAHKQKVGPGDERFSARPTLPSTRWKSPTAHQTTTPPAPSAPSPVDTLHRPGVLLRRYDTAEQRRRSSLRLEGSEAPESSSVGRRRRREAPELEPDPFMRMFTYDAEKKAFPSGGVHRSGGR